MVSGASGLLTDDAIIRLLQEQSEGGDALADFDSAILAHLRPAAVLVPLLLMEDQWHLLFTRRTETVNSHKGQVSFPGGAGDPGDVSPEETALREAFEEIGLRPEDVRVYGRLASRPTVSSFMVTPVVGRVRWPNVFQVSPHEVSRVFTIPLDWLADPVNWEERPRTVPGFSGTVIYYQTYDGEILWGATARITLDLLRTLRLTD